MHNSSLIKDVMLFKTCWFCKTRPPDPCTASHIALCKTTCFLDTYTNQIIELVLHYEPTRFPLTLEIIHEARCGDDATRACALNTLEAIFDRKPAGLAVYKQLQMQHYIETAGQVRYRSVTIDVPRCATCRNIHGRTRLVSRLIGSAAPVGVGLAGLGILATLPEFSMECLSSIHLVLLVLVSCIAVGCLAIVAQRHRLLHFLAACATRHEHYKNKFPLVMDKMQEGWLPGSKPPTTPYITFWGIKFLE